MPLSLKLQYYAIWRRLAILSDESRQPDPASSKSEFIVVEGAAATRHNFVSHESWYDIIS